MKHFLPRAFIADEQLWADFAKAPKQQRQLILFLLNYANTAEKAVTDEEMVNGAETEYGLVRHEDATSPKGLWAAKYRSASVRSHGYFPMSHYGLQTL